MTDRIRATLGSLGLIVVSTLGALAVGELVVRHAFPPIPETLDDRMGTTGAYEADPVLGWRPRPNMTHHSRRFKATYTTNSRGLRGPERGIERAPGVRRIVVLGDSLTWGYGVNDADVFPRILESSLQNTEVVNLGVNAFGLTQEFDYLKVEGQLHQPDIVILALCQNDIFRVGRSPQEIYRARSAPRPPRVPPPGLLGPFKAWLTEEVILYRLAQQAVNADRTLVKTLVALGLKDELGGFYHLDTNLMPALRTYPPRLQISYETTEAELLLMRDWLAERRIRFILALIPARQAIEFRAFQHSIAYTVFDHADFDLDKPYRKLETFARTNGIEVVNAYPDFKHRADAGASLYLRNDMHFSPAGHAAFAAEIAAHLQRPR